MRNNQIFFAASFSDIMKELLLHRPSGLLSLWRAQDSRQNVMQIIIEHGSPTYARRGLYEEHISAATLLWLNQWRNVYFTFQAKRAILQLPAPDNRLPTATPPLTSVAVSPSLSPPAVAFHIPHTPDGAAFPTLLPPQIVPSITPHGKSFPLTALPRYDRTIFLLINGRRTIADLAQLTRRPSAEIYASLTRLQKQQLIVME